MGQEVTLDVGTKPSPITLTTWLSCGARSAGHARSSMNSSVAWIWCPASIHRPVKERHPVSLERPIRRRSSVPSPIGRRHVADEERLEHPCRIDQIGGGRLRKRLEAELHAGALRTSASPSSRMARTESAPPGRPPPRPSPLPGRTPCRAHLADRNAARGRLDAAAIVAGLAADVRASRVKGWWSTSRSVRRRSAPTSCQRPGRKPSGASPHRRGRTRRQDQDTQAAHAADARPLVASVPAR